MTKSKLMVGSISYLHPDMKFLNNRIEYHRQQLRMWERFGESFPYYRTEIFWNENTEKELSTTLDLHSIKVKEPCFVGGARNKILQEFYKSDCDYLVLCDDDCIFDPEEECFDFIRQITPVHAKRLELIAFLPETFYNKSDLLNKVIKRQNMSGYILNPYKAMHGLAICMIPNVVKYGVEPIYFHELDTSKPEVPTEDVAFLADWFKSKCLAYDTMILFSSPLDCSKNSAVFRVNKNRELTKNARLSALDTYIRKVFPRRGTPLNYKNLYLKNPAFIAGSKIIESTIPRCRLKIES